MKRDGWSFASHSYGHINFEKTSLEGIKRDTKRWKDEVEPIVGKTDMFVFPPWHRIDIHKRMIIW